jgi:hypothetical protein
MQQLSLEIMHRARRDGGEVPLRFKRRLGTSYKREEATQRGAQVRPSEEKPVLLHDVARSKVPRIKRLAPGEPFVLAMVKANAVFAKPPAEIDLFVVDQGRKI